MPYAMRKLPNSNKYRVYDLKTGRVYAKGTTKANATKQMAILRFIKNYPAQKAIYGGDMVESLINTYEPLHKRRMPNPHIDNIGKATTHYTHYEHQFKGGAVSADDIAKAQQQAKKEAQNAYQINQILHPVNTSSWAVNKINGARNDFQNTVNYRGLTMSPAAAAKRQQEDTYQRNLQRRKDIADYQAQSTAKATKPEPDALDDLGKVVGIASKVIPFIL